LGDLGSAKEIMSNATNPNANTFAGTIPYMSPEMWKGDYTYTTDIWSLGCVVFELKFLKMAYPMGMIGNPVEPNFGKFNFFISNLKK
jgi:serine/threonine protein kinase